MEEQLTTLCFHQIGFTAQLNYLVSTVLHGHMSSTGKPAWLSLSGLCVCVRLSVNIAFNITIIERFATRSTLSNSVLRFICMFRSGVHF